MRGLLSAFARCFGGFDGNAFFAHDANTFFEDSKQRLEMCSLRPLVAFTASQGIPLSWTRNVLPLTWLVHKPCYLLIHQPR